MGAGASTEGGTVIPDKLDVATCKSLAGDKFDAAAFDAAKDADGFITRDQYAERAEMEANDKPTATVTLYYWGVASRAHYALFVAAASGNSSDVNWVTGVPYPGDDDDDDGGGGDSDSDSDSDGDSGDDGDDGDDGGGGDDEGDGDGHGAFVVLVVSGVIGSGRLKLVVARLQVRIITIGLSHSRYSLPLLTLTPATHSRSYYSPHIHIHI
jgi:hypothetical protein